MGLLLPAALGLLALAIPIIVFYMLRLRREELFVSSSLLWQRALQDRTANAPWQRLRRNLLLLLQLLLLLLLVISLGRPFFLTDAVASGNLVVVLDSSASMQAMDEDGGERRFERARREAARLIDGLQGGERMSLVLAGPSAAIVASASSNKASLHSSLRALRVSNGKADMGQALTLAAASARQLGEATVVLISDGSLAPVAGQAVGGALPQMPAKARYVNVGKTGSNVAITSMSLRDAPGGPQLFAGLYNSGPEAVQAILSIRVDGELRDSRNLDLEAGGDGTVTLDGLPLDTKEIEASLTMEGEGADLLAADNRAWALRAEPPASNVLLVSEGNGFLEKALTLLPSVKVFKAAPADYAPSEGFGLTVLDGVMPSPVPGGNLLIFAPPNSALVPVSGTLPYPGVGPVAVNDPLLRFVDFSQLHIASAKRMETPPWARVLARTVDGDPLIMAGEPDGRRVVVVAFDLHQTDLPLQIAFPIMVANLVDWLQPSTSVDAPPEMGAGDPISIRPRPQADEIVVVAPGDGGEGERTTLQTSGQVSFAGTEELGVYTVEQRAGGQPLGEPERFAVNLFSREESEIAPRPDLAFTGVEGSEVAAPAQRPLEIWPWVLLASLLLLSVEWWFYHRAGRVGLRLPFRRRAKEQIKS